MSERKYIKSLYDLAPVSAIYTPQVNPMHVGNPCIEALENNLEPIEIAKLTGSFPPYDESLGKIGNRFDRMSMLRDFVGSLRIPFTTDVPLYIQTRQLICSVYIRNNILSPDYWDDITPQFISKQPYEPPEYLPPEPYGFLVIGDSGCGKSTSLEQISRILRRIIIHERYLSEPLRQVPMLIVHCPHNTAIGGFLQEILSAADALLHTHYHDRYVKSGKDLTSLKQGVRTVCRNHNIGVIFVDEAQNLAVGSDERLVSYLARFNETVKVPLVLVGTPDVREVWSKSFSSGRRLSGSGPIELYRFPLSSHPESPLYKFCQKLERYQFTPVSTLMTKEIITALGEVSGGNPDQLKKAWIYVKARSIEWKRDKEPITTEEIKSIKGKFSAVEKAIDLLVNKQWDDLRKAFKDLDPNEVVFVPAPKNDSQSDEMTVPSESEIKVAVIENDEPPMDVATEPANIPPSETVPNSSTRNPLLKKAKRARAKVDKLLSNQDKSDKDTPGLDSRYDQLKEQGLIGFG